jgi:hypothetical protein
VKCPGCAEIFTASVDGPAPAKKEEQVRKKKDEDDSGGYEVVNEGKKKRRTDDEDDGYEVAADSRKRRRSDDDEDDERVSEKPRVSRRGRADDEDDDDEDRSRRSRRRLADEDEDDEEEAPRRRPSIRKKKRRRKKSPGLSGLGTTIWVLLGVVGVCLLMAIVGIFVPGVSAVPAVVGNLMMLGGGLWLLVIAFQDEVYHGLLCLCVPFYSIFYVATHFEETKNALFLWLIGLGVTLAGACGGGIGGAMRGEPVHDRQPRMQLQAPALPVAWSSGHRAG